jgi:uncharacterized protein (DUF488 family)
MDPHAIYTIGYGTRTIEELIRLLNIYRVEYLIDVRSQPYSRFKPEFTKDALEARITHAGLRYVYMGDTLGGIPDDQTCYVNGKVDYSIVRQKAFYQEGIKRLHIALDKGHTVALMCSEGKPQECHRTKLIGETLTAENVAVRHIDEGGMVKTQAEVVEALTHGQQSLFDVDFMSKKKY